MQANEVSKKKWQTSKKTEKGGVYIELMVLVYLCINTFLQEKHANGAISVQDALQRNVAFVSTAQTSQSMVGQAYKSNVVSNVNAL